MADFFRLVKVQALSLFGINKTLHSKKRKRNAGIGGLIGLFLVFAVLIVAFGDIYARMFAEPLLLQGKIDALVPLMIGLSALLSFFLTFYSVGNTIFGFKDYDMLASMPIKPLTIVLAKFFFVYIVDFAFCLLLSVPTLVVYFGKIGEVNGLAILTTLVACLTSPLLPLALATVVGMGVYYLSSKFKRKNIVQTIMLVILSVALFGLSFISGFISGDNMAGIDFTGIIGKVYFLFPMLVRGMTNPLMMLSFAGINVGSAFVVVAFVCAFYKKLNTVFTAKRTSRNFKLREYKTVSVNRALFGKEIRRLFSCPAYAVNSLMGALLGIIISIGYSVLYQVLGKNIGDETVINVVFGVLNRMLPAIFAFMFLMTPTTVASISLEGQSFWIIKSAPIPFGKVCMSKIWVNTIFCGIPAFISGVVLSACTGMPFYDGILLTYIALAISHFGGNFGLLMNLRFPKLKWKTETEVVKQGLPTLMTILTAFGSAVVLGVLAFFLPINNTLLFGIFAVLFTGLFVLTSVLLAKKGKIMYDKIN